MASATASAVAQAIAMNPQASIPAQSSHNPVRSAKATDPEPFDRNRDKTEEFVRAICITVTMQMDTFADERMKVLYALFFMRGGMAQVWAANETMAVINGMSQMQTLDIFLENVEKSFGDPDRARTARAQLHDLKMIPGTMAEDYTARFEMLAGRTSFNDEALEDAYIQGLPNSILQKVFAQVTPQGSGCMEDGRPEPRPSPPRSSRVEMFHRRYKPDRWTHKSNYRPTATSHCRCRSVYTRHSQPTNIGFHHSHGCRPAEGMTGDAQML